MDKGSGSPGPMGRLNGHLDGDQLGDLAEGTLAAEARAAAEAHLQGCEACRREFKVVQGYFSELAGLESVRAPANFLAQVRARIDKPSPWKSFWSMLGFGAGRPRPLRFIPAQIVVLTVLGIGIATLYIHNNGGLESRPTEMPLASQAPASASASPNAPVASLRGELQAENRPMRKKEAAEGYADKLERATTVEKRVQSYAAAKPMEKEAKAPAVASELPKQTASKKDEADFAPSGMSHLDQPRPAPMAASPMPAKAPPAAPPPAPDEALAKRSSPAPQAEAKSKSKAVSAVADAKETESLEMPESAPSASGSAYGSASGAVSGSASESIGRNGVLGNKDRDDAAKSGRGKLNSAPIIPGFTVRMRSLKDSTALVSGLKAMGAEPDAAPKPAGTAYAFRIPGSLSGEVQGYLERYGKVERLGILPAAPGASVLVYLRLLPSAK